MFKSKTKNIQQIGLRSLIGLAIIFSIRGTFALTNNPYAKKVTLGTALDALTKTVGKSTEIDKMFDGKTNVENLYSKALEIAKSNELKSTKVTIDQINFMFPAGTSDKINKKDLLNVLYDSNRKVRRAIQRIQGSTSEPEIQTSYKNIGDMIPDCKKKIKSKDKNDCVKLWVNNSFSLLEQNTRDMQTFNQDNYGEDIFMNGSTDDSNYDLIVDIDRIGNLLFDSFKAPTETLFYRFPKIQGGSKGTNGSNSSGGPTDVASLLQSIAQNKNNNGSTVVTTTTAVPTNTTTPTTTTTTNTTTTTPAGVQDAGIQKFLQETSSNTTATSLNGTPQGNECVQGVAENLPEEEVTPEATDSEIAAYLSGLDNFITSNLPYQENNNVTNITNQSLSGGGAGDAGLAAAVSNRIDEMFDPEQVQKCSDKCSGLPPSDKVICQIECLCFMVSYPNPPYTDPKLTSMNDALKLRFCTIPVQANRVSKGSDILSWDAMLTRIKDLFQNLLNGGQMVKYQRTKEYLDNPIADLKWNKMFSFEIKINAKPIFNNKNAKAQKTKEANQTKKMESAVADKNPNPGLDTNKYVIISDILKTKTDKEFGSDLDDYTKKLQEAKLQQSSLKVNQDNLNNLQNIANNKTVLINETIIDFLSKNSNFWYSVTEQMLNFNDLANILKNKL